MRILIVDDSVLYRSQIKAALDVVDGIEAIQTAANGKIALERLEQNTFDVVILDLEMPEMDGMTTLTEMRKRGFLQKVIIYSATSKSAIDIVFAALAAGASDFITKPTTSGTAEETPAGVKSLLVPKILQFQKKISGEPRSRDPIIKPQMEVLQPKIKTMNSSIEKLKLSLFKPRAIGIGSSTGGPAALTDLFTYLKDKPLHVPIFIAQHMPAAFTGHFAKSLQNMSGQTVVEAKHGEIVQPGYIYVAPGDFHMTVQRESDGTHVSICLDQGPKRNSVRPAVDNLFESLASVYGGLTAGFVLTGMGEDGVLGAKAIKSSSGAIVIQDEASSVVWGMPGAIYSTGSFDGIGNIPECAQILFDMAK
jgi:two-component system chemotaxis response regulator CheB